MSVKEKLDYITMLFVDNCNEQIRVQTLNRYYLLRQINHLLKSEFSQIDNVLLFGFTFRIDMEVGGKLSVKDLAWIEDVCNWEFEGTNDAGYLFKQKGIITTFMSQDNESNLRFYKEECMKINKKLLDISGMDVE